MKVPVLADDSSPLSGISDDVITRVGDALVALPEGFKVTSFSFLLFSTISH